METLIIYLNTLILLLRKDYLDSWKRFNEILLPDKEDF